LKERREWSEPTPVVSFHARPLIWTPFPFLNPGPYKKLT
jgi:hypothetical protein